MTRLNRVINVTIMTALLTTIVGGNLALSQTSYPMTCRGGGNLSIRNTGNNNVKISFRPGSGAVYQGLNPGECTWTDRALRPGEPTIICDNSSRVINYITRLVQNDGYATVDVYNNGNGCMQVTRWVN
ncbi:hypothetical protein VB715_18530 [Crocosphaera sp. UHCC 0190]|uniref:hypothetical protein n=1 Tax=Crocosphaera sp. UHCC 0190 TaxID=3110246 RepID=UPI002B1ED5B4|nr:hypothetical protein [Crocosphaera sp. UHCC 0190]MEA5511772.1 hypothetical protein [Crocosphaera sp. UHCC 0190]